MPGRVVSFDKEDFLLTRRWKNSLIMFGTWTRSAGRTANYSDCAIIYQGGPAIKQARFLEGHVSAHFGSEHRMVEIESTGPLLPGHF